MGCSDRGGFCGSEIMGDGEGEGRGCACVHLVVFTCGHHAVIIAGSDTEDLAFEAMNMGFLTTIARQDDAHGVREHSGHDGICTRQAVYELASGFAISWRDQIITDRG